MGFFYQSSVQSSISFSFIRSASSDAIRRSIETPSLSDWDFLINLSESDFPVMTLHDFETQLRK